MLWLECLHIQVFEGGVARTWVPDSGQKNGFESLSTDVFILSDNLQLGQILNLLAETGK
jgi:hypothetical protein